MRAAVLLSLCLSAQAFVGQRGASYKPTSALRSTPENTVEALRAAAAKAREEVQKMEQVRLHITVRRNSVLTFLLLLRNWDGKKQLLQMMICQPKSCPSKLKLSFPPSWPRLT